MSELIITLLERAAPHVPIQSALRSEIDNFLLDEYARRRSPISPNTGGQRLEEVGEADLPEAFETWWSTSPRRNNLPIGYSDKKCLAFDAFEAGANLSNPLPSGASDELVEIDIDLLGAHMVLESRSQAATDCLAKNDWRPSRTHLEGARNAMREAMGYLKVARKRIAALSTPEASDG